MNVSSRGASAMEWILASAGFIAIAVLCFVLLRPAARSSAECVAGQLGSSGPCASGGASPRGGGGGGGGAIALSGNSGPSFGIGGPDRGARGLTIPGPTGYVPGRGYRDNGLSYSNNAAVISQGPHFANPNAPEAPAVESSLAAQAPQQAGSGAVGSGGSSGGPGRGAPSNPGGSSGGPGPGPVARQTQAQSAPPP